MSYVDPIETDQDPALRALGAELAASASCASRCRRALAAADANLADRFRAGEAVGRLVRIRAEVVDQLLLSIWQRHELDRDDKQALLRRTCHDRVSRIAALHNSTERIETQ